MGTTPRRLIAITAVALAVAWPLMLIGSTGDGHEVEVAGLLSEAAFCALALFGLGGILRASIPPSASLPMAVGLLALFVGSAPDVVDEVFDLVDPGVILVQHLGEVLGSVLVGVGAYRWAWLADREVEKLEESSARLATLSITDPLTGLYNRAHLAECLPRLLAQVEPSSPLSLIMIDIDDFKRHNDEWGHPEGDKVIATLADVIRHSIRASDVAFRYGGEEFAVLLPGADLERGLIAAERIRKAFAHRTFRPRQDVELHKTVSLGLARALEVDTPEGLIERADEALYAAKRSGKDRVVSVA